MAHLEFFSLIWFYEILMNMRSIRRENNPRERFKRREDRGRRLVECGPPDFRTKRRVEPISTPLFSSASTSSIELSKA